MFQPTSVICLHTEDICNTEFSLAYGGKILLHNTKLHLKRGRRYGMVGKNGVGKTTLMRNIASKSVEVVLRACSMAACTDKQGGHVVSRWGRQGSEKVYNVASWA